MMRIITGSAKGIHLQTLPGDVTRPTSERSKEAIFSMLCFDIEGRDVLDIFAGSGQMGLEALSRGANFATFIDKSPEAVKVIRANVTKTKLSDNAEIFVSDAFDFIKRNGGRKYDIVFIDPPYALRTASKIAYELYNSGMLKPSSLLVCESEEADIFDSCSEARDVFEEIKHKKFGMAHISLLALKATC